MLQKKLFAVVAASILMWASEAQATAILTVGNIPQAGDENILLNTGITGNPIFGETQQTDLLVRFTGQENLTAPLNDQARVEGADGFFTYLNVDIPNGSFNSLILNLNATINGTVDFVATTNTGVQFFNNFAVAGSGSNFFTFTTIHGQSLLSLALTADGPLQFADAAQFRIGGAQLLEEPPPPAPVPEPASMLLLGTGLAGLAARRYRRRA